MRHVYWPDATTHVYPTETVPYGDDEGGMYGQMRRWPGAREGAVKVLAALDVLPFVKRVVVDAAKPFEVVCHVPKSSDDFDADARHVAALVNGVFAAGAA